MARGDGESDTRDSLFLLSRYDWVYLLSLLVPFIVFSLTLKTLMISSRRIDFFDFSTPYRLIYPAISDIFFLIGYALFWVGLLAVARKGPLRWGVVILFHVITGFVVIVKTSAQQYYQETGTTLDFTLIALWLPRVNELMLYILQGIPPSAWVLLTAILFYTAFGPWLVASFVGRRRGWIGRPFSAGRHEKISLWGSLVSCSLALGFGLLSSQVGSNLMDRSLELLPGGEDIWQIKTPLLRDPFVHVMVTGAKEVQREAPADITADLAPENSPPANLLPTGLEKRNVALILLESTRAQSVTPYNEDLKTTPFLNELAKSSLLAEVKSWSFCNFLQG